ncbi:hypothetical protein M432DRAFT_638262 [Thermoascus aurantiacus ATCC 26904]
MMPERTRAGSPAASFAACERGRRTSQCPPAGRAQSQAKRHPVPSPARSPPSLLPAPPSLSISRLCSVWPLLAVFSAPVPCFPVSQLPVSSSSCALEAAFSIPPLSTACDSSPSGSFCSSSP